MRYKARLDFGLAITNNKDMRCHFKGCSNRLAGNRGYVRFKFERLNYYDNIRINICRDCFDKMMEEYEQEKKNIWKKYKKHQRKLLIRKLLKK